jgi:predicted TIM-barrel fold metal-dependent hydrolase
MSDSSLRLTRRQFLATSSAAAGLAAATASPAAGAATRHERLIVDAQVHIWLPSTPQQPWPNPAAEPQMPDPYTLDRLIPMMDEGGIDRVVLVPPSWHGAVLGNAYCQEAYKQYPERFRIIGIGIGLDQPHRVNEVLTIRDQPGFLGLRVGMNRPALTSGSGDWLFAAAEKAGVPICFLASGVNALVGPVAERFPGLTMIVDHMGVSEAFIKANPNTWQDEVKVVASLAKYPNVSVKVSSTPFVSSQGYPWRDTIPLVQRCFDAFGPLRCHWGTDLTHSFDKGSYRLRVAQFTEALPFLTENDKDWIMGRSLLARLRWA